MKLVMNCDVAENYSIQSLVCRRVRHDLLVVDGVLDEVAGDGLADGDLLLEHVGLRDSSSVNDYSGSVEIYILA